MPPQYQGDYRGSAPPGQGPPRRMPGRVVGREDIYRYQAAAGAQNAAMTEGQRAAELAAQQERDARERIAQQANAQQNAWAAVANARTYTPADFTGFSDEQLQAYKMQGEAWKQSAKNFENALDEVLAQRAQQATQGPTTFQQPPGAVATGPKFTEVSPEAARAAEVAATTYPAQPTRQDHTSIHALHKRAIPGYRGQSMS